MLSGPLHRLWDMGKECRQSPHTPSSHCVSASLCSGLHTSVQVRSPRASFGDPSSCQYSWSRSLESNAIAKWLLIFPSPSKTISAKNRPIVCFFSLAAIGKPFLPLIERRVAWGRHFYNFLFSSESWQSEFRRFSLQASDPRVHANYPSHLVCSSSFYMVPRKETFTLSSFS